MKMLHIGLMIISVLATAPTFGAKCKVDLNLKTFQNDSKAFMNARVQKRDENCKVDNVFYFFAKDTNGSIGNKYVSIKDSYRANFCHTDKETSQKICLKDVTPGRDVELGRAPIESMDRAENLVTGSLLVTNLFEMNEKKLEEGSLDIQPWSDWYWPIYVGQISYRFLDSKMQFEWEIAGREGEEMWSWMIDWHSKNTPLMIDPNFLSPSEKYDMLVGDSDFTLTNYMLNTPKNYAKDGKVASWMGICHGWAPASYMVPRPSQAISVLAADGETKLRFLPSELKALVSQSWATSSPRVKFVGARCNAVEPEMDENGRVLEKECFDNNPGTWHMAIVNELGINKKSFVMDATFDSEVWNHPVTAYSYSYFNPESMEEMPTLEKAIVDLNEYKSDKFKKYRSRDAVKVVGIVMEVEYLVETMPSASLYDGPVNDAHNTAYYVYDLELNADNEIVGGEWYSNKHPDFIWTPYEDGKARSVVDGYIREKVTLDNLQSIKRLNQLAAYASRNGQPIGKIVEALVEKSAKKEIPVVVPYAGEIGGMDEQL